MEDDLNGIEGNIRACIISNKRPMSVRNLSRDYETYTGHQIPYRQHKFSSLEAFLKSFKSLRVCGSGDMMMVEAASSEASSHIAALISKQKSSARKVPPRSYPQGGRGRGRGNYYSSRPALRETNTRRDYSGWNQSNRDNSDRQRSWDYCTKGSTAKENVAERDSRPDASGDHSSWDNNRSEPKRYSPNLQVKHDYAHTKPSPLTIKVEDDKRKVYRSAEVPPRFRKVKEQSAYIPQASSVTSGSQGFETDFILDSAASTSASIISPLGPSQLIAAGRAKQEEEKAKWKQQSYGTPSDFLWQSSSQRTNNLTADFARLSHQDSFNGADAVTLQNHQASFIGQQIAEDPSVLPLPEAEVPLPADPTSLNYIDVLHRHCKSHGWPDPTYKVVPHKCPDTRKIVYFASVTVNGEGANAFKISTIPFEHVDVTVVTEYAAQKALERILEEESKVKGDKKISSDKNIICKRISEIVAGATTGLFAKSVEDEYDRRYNELLPHDWQETVKKWPTIDVEETVNSTIIVPRVPSPEVNQINFDPTCAPPLMPIENLGNHEGYEDVYVTHATSVSSVWFRVIGKDYSEKYDELLDQMGQYYDMTGAQELAITLEVGQYYAAYKCQTWFRVCVLEVDEANKTVTAWLIDLGDNDIFEFGSLYRLAPQFCELPQQAVQCILEGLESFGTDKIACEVVMNSELLIDKTLIAKIVDKDSEFLKVILYDTSGDDDIVVNEEIKREIIEKTEPELPAEGCVAEVVIGDISRKGEVYIMFPGPSLDRIAELIESLGTDKINKHKLNGFKHIMENKLYLARYTEDDMWYRAVVTGPHSVQLNKIPVRFVDYGNTESVEISNMADLESLSPFLYKVPYQSKQVALHNIPCESLTNSEIAKLHSLLLDEDKSVLIKTISRKADPPIVEIFTKEADTSGPVSVCFTIELDRKNKNSPSLTANANIFDNIQDEFDLASPDFILDKNSYEIVLIPLAAHPGNFIFQPYKYQLDLKKLKGKMCAYYEAGSLPELSINRIVKNKLFAAQYEADGMWYRVVVTDSPMGSKVAVRLCDFGDCSCVNISSLRELAPEFHKYPFMAVKGKLAGVKPLHKDWSVEDCIRFQDLVVTKLVAGQVEHIETNQNTMDMVVTLTLIDTTSAVDVNIADILVNEQRAVKET